MSALLTGRISDNSTTINSLASLVAGNFAVTTSPVSNAKDAIEVLVIKIHAQISGLLELAHTENFAIEATKILQVCEQPVCHPIPFMPSGMLGIISLRGRTFPVLCLSSIMELGAIPCSHNTSLLLAEMKQHNLLGFAVPNVVGKVKVERLFIKNEKEVNPTIRHFVTGLCDLPDQEVAKILDLDAIACKFFSSANTKTSSNTSKNAHRNAVSKKTANPMPHPSEN